MGAGTREDAQAAPAPEGGSGEAAVRVAVRVRPLLPKEKVERVKECIR